MIKIIFLIALISISTTTKADELSSIVAGNDNTYCLAETIFRETRGLSVKDKRLVGHVVMNRIADGRFQDTACEVMHAPGQFPWVARFSQTERKKTIKRDRGDFNQCLKLARQLMARQLEDISKGALYFRAPKDSGKWANCLRLVVKTKHHYFYARKT